MNERILIVEDDVLLANELHSRLSRMGYVLTGIAATGEDAIQRAEADRPDLVLMDIHLAGKLDGIETAGQIFQRFRIPAIYLTAYSDHETVQRVKHSQSFGYILKPLRERELETSIDIALHNFALKEELRQHREHLEVLVDQRTAELTHTNHHLRQEIATRLKMEEELRQHREHLEELVHERTAELQDANRQLAHEIAQRERIEHELRQAKDAAEEARHAAESANRAKGEFLANMSHELRTPMTAIMGFTQLIARDDGLTATTHDHVNIILHSGEHLLVLINDVLDMSKIEAGRFSLSPSCFDLYAMVSAIEDIMRIRAEQKGLQLTVVGDEHTVPCHIMADEKKLRQVLINLLSNAIKFTEQGHITLRVKILETGNSTLTMSPSHHPVFSIQFQVSDTGIGIATEELNSIFNAFERSPRSMRIEGTGLGLSISQKFVQLMGGHIAVESRLGVGSTFSFTIAVEETIQDIENQPLRHSDRVLGVAPLQTKYRILVADDAPEASLFLERLLTSIGFQVRVAVNGQDALEQYQQWQPHSILMDMRMPIMDGYEATRRIRAAEAAKAEGKEVGRADDEPGRSAQTAKISQQKSHIPIFALTAATFTEEHHDMLMVGCTEVLTKPIQEQVLLETLHRHLHVQYVVAPPASSERMAGRKSMRQGTLPETLALLPCEDLGELESAITQLDAKRISLAVEAIQARNGHAGDTLRRLTQAFRYRDILSAIHQVQAGENTGKGEIESA